MVASVRVIILTRQTLAEGNALIRHRINERYNKSIYGGLQVTLHSCQEQLYLQFLSAITNDILKRGVYSDLALETLFESHVTLNKQRLREVIREMVYHVCAWLLFLSRT